MKKELPQPNEYRIIENNGYNESSLLEFLRGYPRVGQIMVANGLLFGDTQNISFPQTHESMAEYEDFEHAYQAFRARVARHTVSVGQTTEVLLSMLQEAGAINITDGRKNHIAEAMVLHDVFKVQEIGWRELLGPEKAYRAAEDHTSLLLRQAGFPPEYEVFAGSIGIFGASDFLSNEDEWSLERQCAYLADELTQEKVVTIDPLAKVRRLKNDERYAELNRTGFSDKQHDPGFCYPDGSLRPKFDIQEESTMKMLQKISTVLGIPLQQLGRNIILKAYEQGIYNAIIE